VARFFTNLTERYRHQLSVSPAIINGEPGIVGHLDGVLDFVAAFEVDGQSVRTIRVISNPDKLRLLTTPAHLL
jgi:hypothetical protein